MASILSMPFLRPLPPPQAHSLQSFLRRIATTRRIKQKTAIQRPTISIPPPSLPATSSATAKSKPPTNPSASASTNLTLEHLPYHVHRTASKQLPIYQQAKRGGNLQQTKVRKIEGDLHKLRDDLRLEFGLKEENIAINHLTEQITIKGWMRGDVVKFLESRGF